MALNIIALILVAAITFMHSIFGIFSGVLNASCSIFALAIAFGLWEPVSVWATQSLGTHPAYTEATALLLLFFGTLALLRYLADTFIRGNMRVPPAVDTVGAIVFGFINAQIAVGMLVISVMLLPLGESTLGFRRYVRTEDRDSRGLAKFERNALWLRTDEFTIWIAKQLSGGSMSTGTALASVYPSFDQWLYTGGNTVQWESSPSPYRDKHGDGVKKGLVVERWWEQTEAVEGRYRKEAPTAEKPIPDYISLALAPESGNKFVVAQLRLNKDAADRDEGRRAVHVFRPTQLRVVGEVGNGRLADAFARIVSGADDRIGGKPRIADPDTNFGLAEGDAAIEVFFEVPQAFKPQFVEYRRRARAPLNVPVVAKSDGKRRPNVGTVGLGGSAAGSPAAEGGSGTARGAGRFTDAIDFPSGDVWKLPYPVSAAKIRGDTELDGVKLKRGRFWGEKSRLEPAPGEERTVDEFKLPEGYRLCQIRYKPRKAASLVGQVFNYANQAAQYRAVDNNGEKHMLAGYYAIIKRDGREYIELFYSGEYNAPGYNSMLDFKEVKHGELTASDDVQVGLFFFVPYGRIVRTIENQTGAGVSDINYEMQQNPSP